jgi:hypothetical protein
MLMARSLGRARRQVAWALALVGVAAVAAIAPAIASAGLFFSGTLSPSSPTACKAAWGAGCAQSGFNNWYAVVLSKHTGDRVALGMRGTDGTFYFFTYGAGGNGHTYTLTKFDLGAPGYNQGFCAYYSGNSSSVDCTASL